MPVDIRELTRHDVARMMDYAILKHAWPESEYLRGCEKVREYGFVAYHVLPSRLPLIVRELGDFARDHAIELGAPIAFPYGSTPTVVKLAEAEQLVAAGATALDMVANIGWLKDREYALYQNECSAHIELCHAAGINGKVIIEVGHLTDDEVVTATRMVVEAGADFVKTATGTGPPGFPTRHQVQLILDTLRDTGGPTGLKVSGVSAPRVLNSYAFIGMGAGRIGTSSAAEIVDALPQVQRELAAGPPGPSADLRAIRT
ncbi:MAG: deoxyribose-phosphate aldolase [Candidatus Dormibacteria bacterium]|jgi:deoxyribose-phosphate aldolase